MTIDWEKLGLREPSSYDEEHDDDSGSAGWKLMPQYDFFFVYWGDPTVAGKPFSVSEQRFNMPEKMRYFTTIESAASHLIKLGCGKESA